MEQVIDNEPARIKGDAEGVHQIRVGLRRLRAAMSLFAALLHDPQTVTIKSELKWLRRTWPGTRVRSTRATRCADEATPPALARYAIAFARDR